MDIDTDKGVSMTVNEVSSRDITTQNGATGKYLARLREDAGLKQRDVARMVTWSPTILSRVEAGERDVTTEELDLILEAIGTEKALNFQKGVRRVWKQLPKPALGHPDESLLWETEMILRDIEEVLNDDEIRRSFANFLEETKQSLCDAARNVENIEHSIALVGDIGVGKSTAICNVAGLLVSERMTMTPTPVLEVGGGGVTICEVHIAQGPGYGLLIEPMNDSELRREVSEFANLLKNPSVSAEGIDDGGGQVISTPKEIERAIRNMSGLIKRRIREKSSDGKIVRSTVDPARELAEMSASESEFVVEILSKMNLDRRTKRELWYTATSTGKEPLLWLKENFEALNNGRHPDFSIPKRLEILVPQPVLGEELLSIRIVDTKGIDSTADRSDIGNLFNDPGTVVVMCSDFNAVPSPTVQRLLERARDARFAGVEKKSVVVALPRPDEALAVKDDIGFIAETVEDGYDLKRDQAELRMQSIGFPDLQVEFFNARSDEPANLREQLLKLVHKLRQHHRSQLDEIIYDARSMIDNFEQRQTLEVQRDAARRLGVWIKSNSELESKVIHGPERRLMSAINSAHPSSVRASVRRQGEWYNLNYPDQLSVGARLLAVNALGSRLSGFSSVTDHYLDDDELEEAYALIRQACRFVNTGVETLLKKCEIEGERIHKRDMEPSRKLWNDCDAEWGLGAGYRDRVLDHHDQWFNDDNRDYLEWLRNLVEREWKLILDRLSENLEIS